MDAVFKILMEENKGLKIKNYIGNGGFGEVREVSYKKKDENENEKVKYYEGVGKLIKRKDVNETKYLSEFRGPGIVKVWKIFSTDHNKEHYDLIFMEKSQLTDSYKLIKKLFSHKYFNLIVTSQFETIGDNLLRFFVKQLVKALEILNRNNYSHFDIKPENILIFREMNLKFTDFGLLRDIENIKNKTNNVVKVPGGTRGYLSPEFYFKKSYLDIEDARKQDYFALGATIFYLKYGEKMLKYNEYKDPSVTSDLLIDLLQKRISEIKSDKLLDEDFKNFLCSLIQYKPEQRPNFEEIYKNKWINKNTEELTDIFEINQYDEVKLILELKKSDYLIKKKKYLYNKRNNKEINNIRQRHKFIFGE